MIKQKSNSLNTSSFIWNTIGSIFSAGSSFILLSCVTNVLGASNSGIFAFAFSSAQLFLTLGKYGVRSYQATDVSKHIDASTYFVSRVISSILMLILCIITIFLFGYYGVSASIIFSVCLLKMVDAVEDVYHGQLQLNHKLNIAGMLLALRNFISIILFSVLIFTTKNIELTCWMTAIASLSICILINHPVTAKCEKFNFCFNFSKIKVLFFACFPLFLGQFLSLYIYNAPKYAIEMYCTSEIQTFYNVIFMPTFVINLLSEFLFKPLLTSLAIWWNDGELKKFSSLVMKLVLLNFIVTIFMLIGAYFVGVPLLSLVFGVDINPYKTEFLILLLGGGFGAVVYFLYNVLTSMRQQKFILINYSLAAVTITFIAFITVKKYSISAASISYLCAEVILCLLMIISVVYALKHRKV